MCDRQNASLHDLTASPLLYNVEYDPGEEVLLNDVTKLVQCSFAGYDGCEFAQNTCNGRVVVAFDCCLHML
jgi:hypothetical protein